jgi:hypothetical protein
LPFRKGVGKLRADHRADHRTRQQSDCEAEPEALVTADGVSAPSSAA